MIPRYVSFTIDTFLWLNFYISSGLLLANVFPASNHLNSSNWEIAQLSMRIQIPQLSLEMNHFPLQWLNWLELGRLNVRLCRRYKLVCSYFVHLQFYSNNIQTLKSLLFRYTSNKCTLRMYILCVWYDQIKTRYQHILIAVWEFSVFLVLNHHLQQQYAYGY